jgi:hypothetical protein
VGDHRDGFWEDARTFTLTRNMPFNDPILKRGGLLNDPTIISGNLDANTVNVQTRYHHR